MAEVYHISTTSPTKGMAKVYQSYIKGMAEVWMVKGGGKVVGIR